LAIGSKIATELLAKLLDDLRASKDESLATLTDAERAGAGQGLGAQQGGGKTLGSLSRKSMPHLAAAAAAAEKGAAGSNGEPPAAAAAAAVGADCEGDAAAAAAEGAAAVKAAAINRSISAGAALGASTAAAAAAAGGGGGATDDLCKDTLGHASGDEAEVEGFMGEDEGFDDEPETIHRLCPTYASDINSPLR